MKIFTQLFLVFICSVSFLTAQDASEMLLQSAFSDLQNAGSMGSETLPYYTFNKGKKGTTKGSALLDESWQEGTILSLDEQLYKAQLRYNAVNDEVDVWTEDEIKVLPPEKVKGIRIGSQIFVPYPHVIDKRSGVETGFLEVLVEGNASLFKRHYAFVDEIYEVHPTQGRISTGDNRIVHKSDYYYSTKNRPAAKLRTNKSSVMDVLSRRRKAVARFAKENDLSPRREEDLRALFEFYNNQNKEQPNN